MRYVPNLIPDGARVLPNYFKGSIYKPTKKRPLFTLLLWVLGLFFLLLAVAYLSHPLMFILFAALGGILIPPGHRLLERMFRFRLTPKIKTVSAFALLFGSFPLASYYGSVDAAATQQQKLLQQKEAGEKAVVAEKERQRYDSLTFYIRQSGELAKANNIKEANNRLEQAGKFATADSDKQKIEQGRLAISTVQSIQLVKTGKYSEALPEINSLLMAGRQDSGLLYYRALCYSKTGNIQAAVNDLKDLMKTGDPEAKKLHDKINPTLRRVVDHVTRCWDGTTSNATGRGACSHHGGVKNWNEPVYEEYTKY